MTNAANRMIRLRIGKWPVALKQAQLAGLLLTRNDQFRRHGEGAHLMIVDSREWKERTGDSKDRISTLERMKSASN